MRRERLAAVSGGLPSSLAVLTKKEEAAALPQAAAWQRWPGLNRRITVSKTVALPLGYISIFLRVPASTHVIARRPLPGPTRQSPVHYWRAEPESNRLPSAVPAAAHPHVLPAHVAARGGGAHFYSQTFGNSPLLITLANDDHIPGFAVQQIDSIL